MNSFPPSRRPVSVCLDLLPFSPFVLTLSTLVASCLVPNVEDNVEDNVKDNVSYVLETMFSGKTKANHCRTMQLVLHNYIMNCLDKNVNPA